MPQGRPTPPEVIERIRELRAEHRTMEEIVEITGACVDAVRAHTRDMGIRCKSGPKPRPQRNARLLRAWADPTASRTDIAHRFGYKHGKSAGMAVWALRRKVSPGQGAC